MTKIRSEIREGNELVYFEKKDYRFEDLDYETSFIEWVSHFKIIMKDDTFIYEDGIIDLDLFRDMVFKIQELTETNKPLMDFIDEITENDEEVIFELHGDEVSLGYLDIIDFYKLEHDCLKIGELEKC